MKQVLDVFAQAAENLRSAMSSPEGGKVTGILMLRWPKKSLSIRGCKSILGGSTRSEASLVNARRNYKTLNIT